MSGLFEAVKIERASLDRDKAHFRELVISQSEILDHFRGQLRSIKSDAAKLRQGVVDAIETEMAKMLRAHLKI